MLRAVTLIHLQLFFLSPISFPPSLLVRFLCTYIQMVWICGEKRHILLIWRSQKTSGYLYSNITASQCMAWNMRDWNSQNYGKTQTIILFHIKSMQFFVEWLSLLNFRKFYHFPEKMNIIQQKYNINLLQRFKWVWFFNKIVLKLNAATSFSQRQLFWFHS